MAQLSNLIAFIEATDQGSFIAASERLHLSHSTVSARIRALEEELGTPLFHRGRHGVKLNEAGRNLLPFAENMVQTWTQATKSVKAIASGSVPILAGIQQDLWDLFGTRWYSQLKEYLPELQLHLTSDYSTQLCERVDQGLLDIALTFEPNRERGVVLEPLVELPVVLASSKASKWQGKLPEDYLHVDWGHRFSDWHEREFGSKINPSLVVAVSSIALSLVRQGQGCSFFLEHSLKPFVKTGEICTVEGAPTFSVKVFLIRKQNVSPSESLKLARDSIKSLLLA